MSERDQSHGDKPRTLVECLRSWGSEAVSPREPALRSLLNAAADEIEQYAQSAVVASEPVAWRFRKTDALGEPMGPWLFSSERPNFELYEPVQPLYSAPHSASERIDWKKKYENDLHNFMAQERWLEAHHPEVLDEFENATDATTDSRVTPRS